MPKRPAAKPDADKVAVTIVFPAELHAAATAAATADDRSLNTYVVRAVRAQIERELAVPEKKGAR